MLTNQEIFDKVAKHLLAQNKQSRRDTCYTTMTSACLYRTPGGLKCAVGCLIDDEHYDQNCEGVSVSKLVATGPKVITLRESLERSGVDIHNEDTQELLRQLQILHDQNEPQTWGNGLLAVAAKLGLAFRVSYGNE